jgi:predicted metal-binding membrane protein
MSEPTPLEYLLRRDRTVVLFGLVGVTALAWAYLFVLAADMSDMSAAMGTGMALAQAKPWGLVDFGLKFLMWSVMMVGMMVPSAAPMILLFALATRKQRAEGRPFAPVGAFVGGYLLLWTAFSLVAATLQWVLEQTALVSPMMVSASPYLGGGILIAAGLYQLTPLKSACLNHCRSPFHFFMNHWRAGVLGGLRMGTHHGAFCVGCCWALMALLFVGGVMNLLWVAVIAGFVLLEKVLPRGPMAGRLTGVALLGWGGWLLLDALGAWA